MRYVRTGTKLTVERRATNATDLLDRVSRELAAEFRRAEIRSRFGKKLPYTESRSVQGVLRRQVLTLSFTSPEAAAHAELWLDDVFEAD